MENVSAESGEKAPEDNARKENTAETLIGSIEDVTPESEVGESENDQSNKSPDESNAPSGDQDQDERLPVEPTEDDLSLAQMMEEMEEDEMELGEEKVKNSSKEEDNVISLDQIMDEMEED